MRTAVRCPVCEGRGTVLKGFYDGMLPADSSNPNQEPCKSCDGKGYLLVDDPWQPYSPFPGTSISILGGISDC